MEQLLKSISQSVLHIQHILNRLLPFATPGTPLIQDILHSIVLASVIYYAPRILERQLERGVQGEETPAFHDEGAELGNEVIDAGQRHEGNGAEAEGPEDLEDHANLQNHLHPEANFDDAANPLLQRPQDPPQQPTTSINPRARNIGKKKARSLARKDQNRAYHEFMRQQGEAQRARDREIEASLEAELFEEKRRRALLEQELEEKRRIEREAKREEERCRREEDVARRKMTIEVVRAELEASGFIKVTDVIKAVGGDIDSAWIERLIRAEGILGLTNTSNTTTTNETPDSLTFITSAGYIVRITHANMQETYQRAYVTSAASDGKIGFSELGQILEDDIMRKQKEKEGKKEGDRWDWEKEKEKVRDMMKIGGSRIAS
ncbi:MAG: hypothetical protein M1840_006206 [Geoglossum simile]|nr:MAG: hypothetical protein M1840_006206 [Geoglossum simile]